MTDEPIIENRKTDFYWASIGGAAPEPVERVWINKRGAVYTLGCNDPFFLDDPNCPVILGSTKQVVTGGKAFTVLDTDYPLPMVRPATVEASADEMAKAERAYAKSGPHRWRGPR